MAAFITAAAEAFTAVAEEKEDNDPPPVVAETVVAHKNLHIGRSWILSGAHSCHQFTIRIPAVFGD